VEAAALSVAGAAGEYVRLHLQMKPTAMVLAMGFVALRARDAGGWRRSDFLLLAALAFSLAGDVFLMLKDYFLQGLVSFLVAHLCYIALFKAGVPWLPGKRIAGIVFGLGAAMYAGLFVFLPNALKIPVALYTTAICLMAAQAMGRASVLRDRASLGVAIGAGFFMASDSLLAVNRFAVPLPMAQFWVLATYYAAQLLIVHHFISPSGTARAGTWNQAADRA
jgi:alkylglycerol monooxygenase